MATENLVVITIWQKQSKDLERKEGKRSSNETKIRAFIFHTLLRRKKEEERLEMLEESIRNRSLFYEA